MNLSLILAIEFPKKKIMQALRIKKLKYDRSFQHTNYLFNQHSSFVLIKQIRKNKGLEAVIDFLVKL